MIEKIKNTYQKFSNMESPNIFDWTLFFALMLFCYITYNHGDILVTSTHGRDLVECILKGDFFGFYDYTESKAVYAITVYIIFAIWSIPVFIIYNILGIPMWGVSEYFDIPYEILMWYKLLPTIFYFAIALVLYKIVLEIKKEKKYAKWALYLFVTSPIAMFSQFIFGQYDSIGLFFTVVALYFFIKKKYYLFSAFVSVAITFKMFALFFFIPLILLVEKRILHLIKYGLIGLSGTVISRLLFIGSVGYGETRGFSNNIVPRLFSTGITTNLGTISLFTVAMMAICVVAYNKTIDSDDEYYSYSIYIPFFVYASMFMFILWHPQWVLFMIPFMTLAFFLNTNSNSALILHTAMGVGYIANVVLWFHGNVDTNMISFGILPKIYPTNQYDSISELFTMDGILGNNFYFSLFAGTLAILTVMYMPTKEHIHKYNITDNKHFDIGNRGFVWVRMLTLMLFIVPTMLTYFK